MPTNWRETLLDEIMGFMLDTVDRGTVPTLRQVLERFPQVEHDGDLRGEVESLLEMHQWLGDSVSSKPSSIAATQEQGPRTPRSGDNGKPFLFAPVGQRWGDFVLVEELGRGGMGEVFKAWQVTRRQFVALKRLQTKLLEDEGARRRFEEEPKHMMEIDDPGVIRVLEVGKSGSYPYFTMELIDGTSLGILARNQALPPDQVARIVRDVARSLARAHEAGILHRDLKPDNILLTQELKPKLGDFGLAKDLGRELNLTASLEILGTCNYMAPEQAAGQGDDITTRTDIYGLGAILYELLTARPPFRGTTAGEVLLHVQNSDPVPPRTVNPDADERLEAICLKCLEKNPQRRYGSAEEVAEEFERVLGGKRQRAPKNTLLRRTARFARRRPAFAGLIALAIASAVALTVTVGIARDQRLAKEKEQGERRLAELNTLTEQARRGYQEGQWQEALDRFQQAVEIGHPSDAELRLEMARCLMVLDRFEEASRTLDEVAATSESPDIMASTKLLQGDLLLGHDNEKGKKLIEDSLRQGLMRKADQAYAKALLARDVPTVIECLRESLRTEPNHQRANQMLPFWLFVLGRLDESEEALAAARAFFPQDQNLNITEAIVRSTQGDHEAAERLLEACEGRVDSHELAAFRSALSLIQELRKPGGGDISSFGATMLRATPLVMALSNIGASKSGQHVVLIPPVLEESYGELFSKFLAAGIFGNQTTKTEIYLKAVDIHPEGTFYLLLGESLNKQGRWKEAEAALVKAVRLPAIADVKPRAHYLLCRTRWQISYGLSEVEQEAYRTQAIDDLRALAKMSWPKLHGDEFWDLTNIALHRPDIELARRVIQAWREQHPKEGRAIAMAGVVEMNADNYAAALNYFHEAEQVGWRDEWGYVRKCHSRLLKQALNRESLSEVAVQLLERSEDLIATWLAIINPVVAATEEVR